MLHVAPKGKQAGFISKVFQTGNLRLFRCERYGLLHKLSFLMIARSFQVRQDAVASSIACGTQEIVPKKIADEVLQRTRD